MGAERTDGDPRRGRRVAFFGGSFDPPHCGHLAVANAAMHEFGLDSVLFTPTGRQPLKPGGASAPYGDRMAMVALACAQQERFCVSGLDAPRDDGRPNYTVDTLERLRDGDPASEIFGIAGADSFLDLPRWYRSDRLLEMAEWIVVSRPGFDLARLSGLDLPGAPLGRVHVLDTVHVRVSASELRARLARGEDCADAMPESVIEYVREHGLYR